MNGTIMTKLLSDRLKYARKTLGKSQEEMAQALGVGLKSWQVYEQGGSVPGGRVFMSLSELGFNANWILTGKGLVTSEETEGGEHAETSEGLSEFGLGAPSSPKVKGEITGAHRKTQSIPFDEGLLEHIIIEIIKNQRRTEDEAQNLFVDILAQSTAASIINAYKMSLDLPIAQQEKIIENYNKLFAKLDDKLNVIADKRGV